MPHREPRSASNETRLISALPMQDTHPPHAFFQAFCPCSHNVLYVQYTETRSRSSLWAVVLSGLYRFRAEPLKSILQEHIQRPRLERGRWDGWEEALSPARGAGPISRGNSPNRELGSEQGV